MFTNHKGVIRIVCIIGIVCTIFIIIISLSCLVVFIHAGYSIAWNAPVDIGATNVLITMMSVFFSGMSVLFAIVTIRQQNTQFFEQEFLNRLQTQKNVKMSLKESVNVITRSTETKCQTFVGEQIFEMMYEQLYYLSMAKKKVYYALENDLVIYEEKMEGLCYPLAECEVKAHEYFEDLKTCFVLDSYGLRGIVDMDFKKACKLVINRWEPKITSYYRHLLNTLNYLDRQCDRWHIDKDIKEECLNELLANLSGYEHAMLFYYFVTYPDCKTLERNKKVLFKTVPHLLDEKHTNII